MYLAPPVARMLGGAAHTFMLVVGVVEIIAGLLVALRPRIGAYVVARSRSEDSRVSTTSAATPHKQEQSGSAPEHVHDVRGVTTRGPPPAAGAIAGRSARGLM